MNPANRKCLAHEVNPRYIGIEYEIETSFDDEAPEEKFIAKDHIRMSTSPSEFEIVSDYSLNSGFEIVSVPMTREYHEQSDSWKKIFHEVNRYGFDRPIEDANTSGIHFTVDLRNVRDAVRLRRYLRRIERENLIEYCRRENWGYCELDNEFDEAKSTAVHIRDERNRHNQTVVEIRVFKSTGDYDMFMSYLRFVDNLVKFILSLPNEDMKTIPWPPFNDLLDDFGKKFMGFTK